MINSPITLFPLLERIRPGFKSKTDSRACDAHVEDNEGVVAVAAGVGTVAVVVVQVVDHLEVEG